MNIKKYRFGEPFCTDSTVIDLPIEKDSPDYISLKEDICTITFIKQRYRQTKLTKLLHIKEETVKI